MKYWLFCNLKKKKKDKKKKENLSLLLTAMTHLTAHFPCRSLLLPHFPPSPKSTMHPRIFCSSSLSPLPTLFPQVPSQDYCCFPLPPPTPTPSSVLPPHPGTVEYGGYFSISTLVSAICAGDTSALSLPEQGCHSETRNPLHQSTGPSLPGPLWAGQPKERIVTPWLEQAGFVRRASSVTGGLFWFKGAALLFSGCLSLL